MGKDRKFTNILICTRILNIKLIETAVYRDQKWLEISSSMSYSQIYDKDNILDR